MFGYGSNQAGLSGLLYSQSAQNSYGPSYTSQMIAMQENMRREAEMRHQALFIERKARWYDEDEIMPAKKSADLDIDSLGPLKYLQARKNQWLKGVL